MTDSRDRRRRILELPQKRLALLALELQDKLDALHEAQREPIAVVGMACRFPGGADSIESYWKLLTEGRDAIREVPGNRWSVDALYDPDPDVPGAVATRWGGFLEDVESFDAGFFSISPREAIAMDPQQRLLLEVTWRAFEDAAIPPDRYRERRAGVFIGICNNDYLTRLLKLGPETIDPYYSSGAAYSVAAGRLSFTFGFQGPAVSVDTACSSSLVAIHQAVRSLRSGESEVAVAGGVNVMSSEETQIALSRARMMAPDGRCKTFDDRADGFVRAEGCGVLILKRLADALRDGDEVHALLRGSAIGQDGRSSGLTVPSGPAQEQVIRDALADGGVEPVAVDYVEAHGTGTSLGDPIEIRALGRVFHHRPGEALQVGSVKTNLGHLESAAGVAGVIKAILAVGHGRIPPHLHLSTPSTHIDWDRYPIEVPTGGRAWPEAGHPRTAGVSSFGFSGTNAHVIVEQAPAVEAAEGTTRPIELLVVSGTSPEARDALAEAYRLELGARPGDFGDFCHTTRSGRTEFPWRSAVVARDVDEAMATLRGDEEAPLLVEGSAKAAEDPGVVLVFTGQGAQHPGMGKELYESFPVFREAIDRCAGVLDPLLGMALTDLLFEGDGDTAPIYRTEMAQPAVVAFEWALSELWRSWGVRPAAVVGHSLGEFVAATVAGVLDLEDMLRLVRERGRLLDSLPGGDRMAAVFTSAETVEDLLRPFEGHAAIGAYNAPENTVVSGSAEAVDEVLAECAKLGIEARELRLDKGFHSPKVEPILDEFHSFASQIAYGVPTIPIAWNVTGGLGGTSALPATYWRDHAREAVRFYQGIQSVAELGFRHFLEVGPHPTLSPLVAQTLGADRATMVPSLRRGVDSLRTIMEAVARLWVEGVELTWAEIFEANGARRVRVPGHPLERDRYWVNPPAYAVPSARKGSVPGARLPTAVPVFETVFTPEAPAFLGDHLVRGEPVLPGPMYLELARTAATALQRSVSVARDIRFHAPAVVGDDGLRIQTVLDDSDGELTFTVLSMPVGAEDARWTKHSSGTLSRGGPAAGAPLSEPSDGWRPASVDEHLERLRDLGFNLGPAVLRYRNPEVADGHARAELAIDADEIGEPAIENALVLDAAVQVMGFTLASEDPPLGRMLADIESVTWYGDLTTVTRCVCSTRSMAGDGSVVGDVLLLDEGDQPVVRLSGVCLRRAGHAASARHLHHELAWREADLDRASQAPSFDTGALEAARSAVEASWPDLVSRSGLEAFTHELPALRSRVAKHVWEALQSLGFQPRAGVRFRAESLADDLGIEQAQRRLVPRLLDILASAGYLAGDRLDGYTLADEPSSAEAPGPGSVESVERLVERCGASLAGVLDGGIDPLSLLFPRGDEETTRRIYGATPFGMAFNEAVAGVVRSLVSDRPDGSTLRILEIGAGSGSTTEAVLEALGEHPRRYLFTDVSPSLVGRAEAAFEDRPGLTFRTLDLEKPAREQGVDVGAWDLVIASNVVHATRDLVESVGHIRELLAPGGVLAMVEGTHPEPWVDITFGLTDGWWRFTDHAVRPDYPTVSSGLWTELLSAADFEVAAFPPDGDDIGEVLILARKRAEPRPVVQALDDGVEGTLGLPAATGEESTEAHVVLDVRGTPGGGVLRVLSARAKGEPGQLWIVTESAQAVMDGDCPNPDAAVAWGLARTYSLEHPHSWGGVIDLAADTPSDIARAQVIQSITAGDGEDQVAWRSGTRHVPRLVASSAPGAVLDRVEPGTYVVSGGLGGLGLKVARWLAEKGATHLVLLGRSDGRATWPEDDPRHADLRALDELGVETVVRTVDITDHQALAVVFDEVRATAPALRGVVHAAAVFDASLLAEGDAAGFQSVLSPKVDGTRNLMALTASDPLDFIVFFSSTTSILGVAGLGAYAAANQFLDAAAVAARTEGVPALSVNWGIWDVMRLASAEEQDTYAQAGLRPMESEAALEAMGRLIASGATSGAVVDADWDRLRSVYEVRRVRPMLTELGATATSSPGEMVAEGGPGGGGDDLAALPADERLERIRDGVETEVRSVLRIPAERAINDDDGFFDMGMDSLMSIDLNARLEKRFGVLLPATFTFNYPTITAASEHLAGRWAAEAERPEASPPAAPAVAAAADVDDESEDVQTRLAKRLAELERGQA